MKTRYFVLSDDQCLTCDGYGQIEDYRCDRCRGTGGVWVELATAQEQSDVVVRIEEKARIIGKLREWGDQSHVNQDRIAAHAYRLAASTLEIE